MPKSYLYEATADSKPVASFQIEEKWRQVSFIKGKPYLCYPDEKNQLKTICGGFFKSGKVRIYRVISIKNEHCKLILKYLKTLKHDNNISSRPGTARGNGAPGTNFNPTGKRKPTGWN